MTTTTKHSLVDRILGAIDTNELDQIWDRHPGHFLGKYHDYRYQARKAAERIERLGLLNCQPIRMLDIGTAFGFLPLAAQLCGHAAIGINDPLPVLDEVAHAVPFNYVPHRVAKYESLPDLGQFELVTILGVNLGYHDADYWGWSEYAFFVRDLRPRLLPGWRIHFEFNRGPNTDFLVSEEGSSWSAMVPRVSIESNTVELSG